MKAYESLAGCYDALTYDIPYPDILSFWEKLLQKNHVSPQTVLDLACGTGSLTVLLAKKGYRVIGADISEEMLTIAAGKADECGENRPFFICQPMQKLRLPMRVDAVVCCLDSVNYVTKPKDLAETFRRVYKALNPGGLFVFDVNSVYKLQGLNNGIWLDETENTYCVWRTEFNEKKKLCRYGMDIFSRKSNGLWERSCEEHLEYAYSQEQLTEFLQQAGFANISVYGDRRLRKPMDNEQRLYFSAKKENA